MNKRRFDFDSRICHHIAFWVFSGIWAAITLAMLLG